MTSEQVTTNEAAKRLRDHLRTYGHGPTGWSTQTRYERDPEADFDAALAAERTVGQAEGARATVERIKAGSYQSEGGRWIVPDAILDEEASR